MWAKIKTTLAGWRTVIGGSVIGVVGALQLIGTVDITPLLKLVLKDDQIVGAVMVVLALGGILMRYITKTPIGVAPPAPVADPTPQFNRGVDAGT